MRVQLLSSILLFVYGCLELRPCFTGLDAPVPRVINICVASASAVSVPRTSASATTSLARFLDGATFGTYGIDGRHHDC